LIDDKTNALYNYVGILSKLGKIVDLRVERRGYI
jgi:hypothetical protein